MYFTFIWFHGQLVFSQSKRKKKIFPCSSQLAHFPGKGSPLDFMEGWSGESTFPFLMILTCHIPGLLPDALRDTIPTASTKNLGIMGVTSGQCHLVLAVTGLPSSSAGKEFTCNAGDLVWFLGQEEPPKKGQATYSSILGLQWWLSW